jgi:type VI secretion system secreted protein Hcp
MAYQVYATVTGSKQGAFKGASTLKGREGRIHVLSMNYGVASPRDSATGLATGRHTEQPLTFSLYWENCSPQFFTAAFTNEALTSVLFEYYSLEVKTAVETLTHTVKLTNASVASVQESFASTTPAGQTDGSDVQTVTLTFQKIEITNTAGSITAIDDWQRPVV